MTIIWQRGADSTHVGTEVIVGRVYHFSAWKRGAYWELRSLAIDSDNDAPIQHHGNHHRTLRDAKQRARDVAFGIRMRREREAGVSTRS